MALALKYRPFQLADLVGQRHVVLPLSKILAFPDRAPSSLIFAGPRGSGKTSAARILGAGLNCKHRSQAGEPCGSCQICNAVANSVSMVVIEIDAASHGLVDDIRPLMTTAQYKITDGTRVIIIDECHNMSPEAFNALLKGLEEPNTKTIFVLVTTNLGRIPDTVQSRSMIFHFQRLGVQDISNRLKFITKAENLVVEPQLLDRLAEAGDGSLRDSIMLLDHMILAGVSLDLRGFESLFGTVDRESYIQLLVALNAGDFRGALTLVRGLERTNSDIVGIVSMWLKYELKALEALKGFDTDLPAGAINVGIPVVLKRITQLWSLLDKIKVLGRSQHIALEIALTLMQDFGKEPNIATQSVSVPAQGMTADQIRSMLRGA